MFAFIKKFRMNQFAHEVIMGLYDIADKHELWINEFPSGNDTYEIACTSRKSTSISCRISIRIDGNADMTIQIKYYTSLGIDALEKLYEFEETCKLHYSKNIHDNYDKVYELLDQKLDLKVLRLIV